MNFIQYANLPVHVHCIERFQRRNLLNINIQFITKTYEKTNITQHAITRAYERKPVRLLIILFLMASHGWINFSAK